MAEVEKYEVLEKIGKSNSIPSLWTEAHAWIGHGSFGIIRKVRRKSDGYVSDSILSLSCS